MTTKGRWRVLLLVCISGLVTACLLRPRPLEIPAMADKVHTKTKKLVVALPPSSTAGPGEMTLQYLGTAGFAIEVGDARIVTAPFFTNSSAWHVVPFVSIDADIGRIDELFPDDLRDANNRRRRVQAILVGHSHYDHLLDVPHLMNHDLQSATAYGSETAAAILNTFGIPCDGAAPRARAVNEAAGRDWIRVSEQVRIFAIPSEHMPHSLGMVFQKGHYRCGQSDITMRTAWDWKMGEVFAYLVDFLDDDGSVAFRVFYQDVANNEALVPAYLLEQRDIDVAILAGLKEDDAYPEAIVRNTRARLYIIGHWEDFFETYDGLPNVNRGANLGRFVSRLEGAMETESQWLLPAPFTKVRVRRSGGQPADGRGDAL